MQNRLGKNLLEGQCVGEVSASGSMKRVARAGEGGGGLWGNRFYSHKWVRKKLQAERHPCGAKSPDVSWRDIVLGL